MKHKILLLLIFTPLISASSAITWKANGGLFGDNLISYSRAKWLSYKHNMPIICREFPYSDLLAMHDQETWYTDETEISFSTVKQLPRYKEYALANDSDTLYICQWKTTIDVDWSDQTFITELKKNIAPRPGHELCTITIPDNCISIAAHFRTGGNNPKDHDFAKETHPLRFVSDQFIIDQVTYLTTLFDTENIYVHIFTDHPQPTILVEKLKNQLNDPRIIYGYRETNNYDINVLEDFFSMMKFDCIVRPQSNFSRFAHLLGKSIIVIYPENIYLTPDGTPQIDVINIHTRAHENDTWIIKQELYHAQK